MLWLFAAAVALSWGMRSLVHAAILRGLRAPRVRYDEAPVALADIGRAGLAVHLPGPGGKRLVGWLVVPASGATLPAPAVLVMHGWGGNAAMMATTAAPLCAAGFAVLLLDARCHGRSDDEAFTSLPRFAEDIAAGLAFLRSQPEVDSDRVALLGHSVGAAAALLHASVRHDVCAVISLSAFAHPAEVMRRWLAERRLPYFLFGWYVLRHVQSVIHATFDEIAPVFTLRKVRCPVLLVHGRQDDTVPVDDAQRLLKAGSQTQLVLVEGGHDLRPSLLPHAQDLTRFLHAAFATCSSGPLAGTPFIARP
jgi:pimeloyl-ACP methyl ester carboxylesterase